MDVGDEAEYRSGSPERSHQGDSGSRSSTTSAGGVKNANGQRTVWSHMSGVTPTLLLPGHD